MSPRQRVDDPISWHHFAFWSFVPIVILLNHFDMAGFLSTTFRWVTGESRAWGVPRSILLGPGPIILLIWLDTWLLPTRFAWYRRTFRNMHWPRRVLDNTLFVPAAWWSVLGMTAVVWSIFRLFTGFNA